MTKTGLITNVTSGLHKAKFEVKKHSPEILIVAGVVGTVASAVMACKATTKLRAVMDDANEKIEAIHYCAEKGYTVDPETHNDVPYTDEDSKKELAIVYVQTGFKLAKLYAPAVALGALSLTSVVTSNHILRKRNMALAAAYTVVDTNFKEYRGRVVDRFGEALDRELRYNIKAKEVEEVVVNEKGEEETVKKTVEVAEVRDYSDYAKFYDDGCIGWSKDADKNLTFLLRQQDWANEKLKAQGYLFLNDVYEALGIPKTRAGHVVGWIYNEKNPVGDNYVDFGIYDIHKARNRDFVNGIERVILLDFNVDGNIMDRVRFGL